MSALLATAHEVEKPVVSHRTSALKLVMLSFIVCGLLRLAILDPLGIGAATASFLGNDRPTVTHAVMIQFKHGIGHQAIDYTREQMINLQYSCAHPYTGDLYIGGIDTAGPPEGFDREHHHVFWLRFRTNDEKDYFMSADPTHKAFQKDVEPFIERFITLSYDDDDNDDKDDEKKDAP